MKTWQKIEDSSIKSTEAMIEKSENPLIKLVMKIIQLDSQMHHNVQEFIISSLEKQAVTLIPDDISNIWGEIEKHIAIEKKMVGYVDEALDSLKGKKMVIQEYLLNYLKEDEIKHDNLLDTLEKIKKGMYPYG
jgi:hypothetical protein